MPTLTSLFKKRVNQLETENEANKSELDLYNEMLDESQRRAGNISALGALINLNVISDAKNAKYGPDFVAPELEAPRFVSPGPELSGLMKNARINEGFNANRKLATELNNPDIILGLNAQELAAKQQIGAESVLQHYEILGKNIEAEINAKNANRAAAADVANKNIEKNRQEDIMNSETINAGIAQLYQMGANYMNSLSTTDYYKMIAKSMYESELQNKSDKLVEPAKPKQ